MSIMPIVTAGLKRPPLILKKTQALTARDIPKQRAMYSNLAGLAARSEAFAPTGGAVLTVFVPPKANRRNKNVPTNSPAQATMWPLNFLGRKSRNGRRRATVLSLADGCKSFLFCHGKRKLLVGLSTFMMAKFEGNEDTSRRTQGQGAR